jgi:protein-tyrosine-phosphatase
VTVSSCGTLDVEGIPALPTATAGAAALGVDLSGHRARTLRPGGLADADLVIGFEPPHVAAAVEVGGARPEHVFMFLELPELVDALPPSDLSGIDHARHAIGEFVLLRRAAGGPRRVAALPDPVGEPPEAFARTAAVIEDVTSALAEGLFGRPDLDLRSGAAPPPAG